jgi:hypothetical protein
VIPVIDQCQVRNQLNPRHASIDDEIEPPMLDVEAGTRQLADRFQNNQGTHTTLSGAHASVSASLSAQSTPATLPRE